MAAFITSARSLVRATVLCALAALSLSGSDKGLMTVQPKAPGTWVLEWRGKVYRCAVGQNGIAKAGEKREGDRKTPSGTFILRGLYFRPDKVNRERLPASLKPIALTVDAGWCDEPGDPGYNRFVKLPYAGGHEDLWRKRDDLYDLILPIGYNDDPVIPGLGSAIFLHVARPDYAPTAGCVALSKQDLLEVIQTVEAGCRMRIDGAKP